MIQMSFASMLTTGLSSLCRRTRRDKSEAVSSMSPDFKRLRGVKSEQGRGRTRRRLERCPQTRGIWQKHGCPSWARPLWNEGDGAMRWWVDVREGGNSRRASSTQRWSTISPVNRQNHVRCSLEKPLKPSVQDGRKGHLVKVECMAQLQCEMMDKHMPGKRERKDCAQCFLTRPA